MIGKTLAHYEITEKIGSGGMGEVYRARDTKLDRDVALKMLPPDMARDPDRRQRFEREAKTVASLNHPNIVTVFSVEEVDGIHFLTMELVTGKTLSQLLTTDGLSLARFFAVAIPLIDAVGGAHDRGITHRDLKPANVMIDEAERVKVLDFGLAKLLESQTDADAQTVAADGPNTEDGRILGTLAYMSPEQAEGKPVDYRSDIFSLGVVLYEMATGRRPFEGETTASTLAAILRDPPPSVVDLKQGLPSHLDRILRRCLDKDPARRFQSAADLQVEIENLKTEIDSGDLSRVSVAPPTGSPAAPSGAWARVRRARLARLVPIYVVVSAGILAIAQLLTVKIGLPGWFLPGAAVLLVIGLPIVAATAIAQASRRVRHWLSWRKAIAGGVLALGLWGAVVTGFLVMRSQGIGPAASLVSAGLLDERDRVLIAEFENHTDDPLLGEAMREALSVDLAQSPIVTVVASGSVTRVLQRMSLAPDTPLDVKTAREVALRDGIKAVVAGRVSPAGGGFVLTGRLLDPETGDVLTASRETARTEDDLIPAIDGLSRKLRERIGESLKSTRAGKPLEDVTTSSLVALQKYTQAIRVADQQRNPEKAIALLEEAVAADTTFAMAYRKLGIVLDNAGMEASRANDALAKAYHHRDRLAERERYLTIAAYYSAVERDQEKAVLAYEQLLDLNPDDHWALNNLGLQYNDRGEYETAEALFTRATEVEPTALNLGNLALCQMRLGRLDDAEMTIDHYLELFPDATSQASFLTTAVAVLRGDYEQAEAHARNRRQSEAGNSVARRRANDTLAAIAATRGKLTESRRLSAENMRLYEEMDEPGEYLDEVVAQAYVEVMVGGDSEAALRAMDDALERHPLDTVDVLERPYLGLAGLYGLAGSVERARTYLDAHTSEVAAGTRRDGRYAHAVRGWIATAEGREQDALGHFRRFVAGSQSDAFMPVGALARAFDLFQEPDSAIVYYERYLAASNPFRAFGDRLLLAGAHLRLGELYEDRGQPTKAAAHYATLIELWKDADPELRERLAPVESRLRQLRSD